MSNGVICDRCGTSEKHDGDLGAAGWHPNTPSGWFFVTVGRGLDGKTEHHQGGHFCSHACVRAWVAEDWDA